MKTYMQNPETRSEKWYLVDATNVPLGRLASQVASILRGKNKPEFTPNALCGDHVVVINCEKVALTGKKREQKYYRHYTGYPGGMKEVRYDTLLASKADEAVYVAVKGMLPKNSLGRKMLKHLRVYIGPNHEHAAQNPELVEVDGRR